jgi:ribosomal-protein-alanine N-acetyltransferase
METSTEAGTVEPAGIENASFPGAGSLHPTKRFRTSAAVVGSKQDMPQKESGNCANYVNGKKASHNVFAPAVALMPMVRPRLRVQQEGRRPNLGFLLGSEQTVVENRAETEFRRFRRPPSPKTASQDRYNGAVPIVIRDFRPEDFETLWRMDQECFPPGISYSKPELRAYIRSRGTLTLVAAHEAKDEIRGFIVAHAGSTGHVITIDVSPEARRTGVGSMLLRAAEERLLSAGARAVGLETAVDNLSALSFYKRHGYSVVRTWPRYYSNGVDALVMKKEFAVSAPG